MVKKRRVYRAGFTWNELALGHDFGAGQRLEGRSQLRFAARDRERSTIVVRGKPGAPISRLPCDACAKNHVILRTLIPYRLGAD